MTLGEIRQGLAALPQSKKRTRLETWLELDLQSRFGGRILAMDGAIADRWGWIMACWPLLLSSTTLQRSRAT